VAEATPRKMDPPPPDPTPRENELPPPLAPLQLEKLTPRATPSQMEPTEKEADEKDWAWPGEGEAARRRAVEAATRNRVECFTVSLRGRGLPHGLRRGRASRRTPWIQGVPPLLVAEASHREKGEMSHPEDRKRRVPRRRDRRCCAGDDPPMEYPA